MPTRTYRRELTPGVLLEAQVTEYCTDELVEGRLMSEVESSTLDAFTLTAFGQVTDLLPDPLKGTEAAFSELGERNGALWDVVDAKWLVDPREERRKNLQRWGLLPVGEEVIVTGRRVA